MRVSSRPASIFALLAMWIISLLLTAASFAVMIGLPIGNGNLEPADMLVMLYASAALLAFVLLVNLAGWLRIGWPWTRLDLVRFNLMLIAALWGGFAAFLWFAFTGNIYDGPRFYYQIYIIVSLLAGLACFGWGMAFAIPQRPSNGLYFLVLVMLGIALVACLTAMGDTATSIYNPRSTTSFTAMAFLDILTNSAILLLFGVVALVADYFGSHPTREDRHSSVFAYGLLFWLASLGLILTLSSSRLSTVSKDYTSAFLVVISLVPVLTTIIAYIRHWRRPQNERSVLALAAVHAAIIGAILLWVGAGFAGLALLDNPHPLARRASLWPGLVIISSGVFWMALGLQLSQNPLKLSIRLFLPASGLGLITLLIFFSAQGFQLPNFGSYRIHHLIEQLAAILIWPSALLFLTALVRGWRKAGPSEENPEKMISQK